MSKIYLAIFSIHFISVSLYSQSVQWLDAAFSGPVFSLQVKDTLAFIGAGSAFTIVNVSNPASPQTISHCHVTDCITYIKVHGNVCYVGNNGMGIAIIDITSLQNPIVKGYMFHGEATGYEPVISGNVAYFPRGSSGIMVMDITDPFQPTQISSWNPIGHDFTIDAELKDSILFITDRAGGIYSINIQHSPPQTIHSYQIPGWNFFECALDETKQYLFVTAYKNTFPLNDTLKILVFNAQNWSNLTPIAQFHHKVYSIPLDLKVKNGRLYVASWSDGVVVVNATNVHSMYHEISIPSAKETNWVEIRNNLIYKADLAGGWNIYDISQPLNPTLVYSWDDAGDTKDIALKDNFIYVAIEDEGVGIAEIKPNGQLEEKLLWKVPGGANGLYIKDTLLFIASGSKGVLVASIQNPMFPDSITRLTHIGENGAWKVTGKDNLLMVGEVLGVSGGLYCWDISNPFNPLLKSSLFFLFEPVHNLHISGNHIAVACWVPYQAKTLKIIDFSNPTNLVVSGSFSCYCSDVKIFERNNLSYAAVSIGSGLPLVLNGLAILNISNPQNIIQEDFYQTGVWGNMTAAVALYDHYALTSEGGIQASGMLRIYDISDPQNIIHGESFQIGSNTSNNTILIKNNHIIHSSGSAGIMIFKWNLPTYVDNFSEKNNKIQVLTDFEQNQLKILHHQQQGFIFRLYDRMGRKISEENIISSPYYISLNKYTQGLYFWEACYVNDERVTGIFLIK
ncbi:MAG: hypothetical protein N2Z72_01270 [Bacteroidales bacterium]|nr:hypothetical protein [Bacteroidales bacterium]